MKKIQVLGIGCPKCEKLLEAAQTAVNEAGIDAQIEKVADLNQITKLGVMMTPGLVIDGTVVSSGKILTPEEIKVHLS